MLRILNKIIVYCRKSSIRRDSKRLYLECNKVQKVIKKQQESLDGIKNKLLPELELAKQSLQNAEDITRRTKNNMEALEEELRVANDVTIPGLVAANRLFVDRWDAESQVFVARNASLSGPLESVE